MRLQFAEPRNVIQRNNGRRQKNEGGGNSVWEQQRSMEKSNSQSVQHYIGLYMEIIMFHYSLFTQLYSCYSNWVII